MTTPENFRVRQTLMPSGARSPCMLKICTVLHPDAGATWFYALFPNVYIDANRHELDLDPEWVSGDWPEPFQTSDKSLRGMGLIPRVCGKGDVALQEEPISAADLKHRLDKYYWPYHNLPVDTSLASANGRHRISRQLSFHVERRRFRRRRCGPQALRLRYRHT